ncbi:hypothetical protein GCM10007116_03270 [Sulfodiicoccus acidiphilus]|uniref:Uncharacterized protein n=1 Tax=Sulfodiicoccus acidiphilus TaxID=1670455 RepID=A0A830GWV4_9CREN|nr:hypothetical protein GCM10007116_03270 [Sulfodiicoccus acidiphilus]
MDRGQSSTGTKGGSHPAIDVTFKVSHMGLVIEVEAYHTDPHFNRGVSATLTPSVTVIYTSLANLYLNLKIQI